MNTLKRFNWKLLFFISILSCVIEVVAEGSTTTEGKDSKTMATPTTNANKVIQKMKEVNTDTGGQWLYDERGELQGLAKKP